MVQQEVIMGMRWRGSIRLAGVLLLLLCLAGIAAAEAPGQLKTVQSGTVSGDLVVRAHQPVPWYSQAAPGTVTSREFTQAFTLPASATGSSVAWARLYVPDFRIFRRSITSPPS